MSRETTRTIEDYRRAMSAAASPEVTAALRAEIDAFQRDASRALAALAAKLRAMTARIRATGAAFESAQQVVELKRKRAHTPPPWAIDPTRSRRH